MPDGLPASLLERRPDIRQAEENLVAANADIGVAKAAYFPDISLTGLLGLESAQLSDLFKGPSKAWSTSSYHRCPGYGFSSRPTGTGWDPDHIARAWAELMKRIGLHPLRRPGRRLGHPDLQRDGAPGGRRDCSASTSTCRRRCLPRWPRCSPWAGPRRRDSPKRSARCSTRSIASGKKGNLAYFTMMTARPQTVGYGATDSPAGLAAWILVHPGLRAVDVRSRSRKVADERRRAGRHHAVLADEHRSLVGATVLGERRTRQRHCCGRAEDRRDLAPGGHHGVPGRRLSPARDMGPARLSQPRRTSTRSTRAGISPHGSSLSSLRPSCVPLQIARWFGTHSVDLPGIAEWTGQT